MLSDEARAEGFAMGSIGWYVNRLRSMSPAEVVWRVSSLTKAVIEAGRVQLGVLPAIKLRQGATVDSFIPSIKLVDYDPLQEDAGSSYQDDWKTSLLDRANSISEGKLSFFDLKNADFGQPINWHLDHSAGRVAPVRHCLFVDYRDFETNGDCKMVWEPNRHHHLVVLARAWRVSGNRRYLTAIQEQLESWFDQNPIGKGMNWKSPLELGVRLINWVWVYDLCDATKNFSVEFRSRWLNSIFYHIRDVASKFSEGSSANNHLVGEAAGVYIAASYFTLFAESDAWRNRAFDILEREITAQTYPDGCTREHALGYQFFVIQFYLFSSIVADKVGHPFSSGYHATLKSLINFVALIARGGDQLPLFGDADDGYVLDLGDSQHSVSALMAWAAQYYKDEQWPLVPSQQHESSLWLFGAHPRAGSVISSRLESIAFNESGYYLLQSGDRQLGNGASVLVDCADLGYQSIAAHGHADALSFTLRLNGTDVFVDPGTYDYFSYPDWRHYFRKTKAHNAVEIDGLDQSTILGPFMWGDHAQAECEVWNVDNNCTQFVGSHTGYHRLADPVTHKRSIVLASHDNLLSITDEFSAEASHQVRSYFHLSEYCEDVVVNQHSVSFSIPGGAVVMEFGEHVSASCFHGDESRLGWLSRGYHKRIPIHTIMLATSIQGNASNNVRISWKWAST
ncbi:alginate lyase family protein [Aurantivibrio plasticivorans]